MTTVRRLLAPTFARPTRLRGPATWRAAALGALRARAGALGGRVGRGSAGTRSGSRSRARAEGWHQHGRPRLPPWRSPPLGLPAWRASTRRSRAKLPGLCCGQRRLWGGRRTRLPPQELERTLPRGASAGTLVLRRPKVGMSPPRGPLATGTVLDAMAWPLATCSRLSTCTRCEPERCT